MTDRDDRLTGTGCDVGQTALVPTLVRLDRPTRALLDSLARERCVSLAEVVRIAIRRLAAEECGDPDDPECTGDPAGPA